MLKHISALILILAFNANAKCLDRTELGLVSFNSNSSYFDASGGNTLKQLIESSQTQASSNKGYLLIEFEFDRELGNADLQKYNMWLAERRVERVKEFLSKGGFGSAMVSRILTAGNAENRDVRLFWCNAPEMPAEQMLADVTPAPREPFIKAL